MKVLVFDCRKVLEINCRKLYTFTCFLQVDGRPEQKLGCVGESEAEAQTARGVGAADGAGNTVIDIWCGVKRGCFFYRAFLT